MGYVGSVLVKQLRQQEPDAFLIGYDLGIFSHCLSSYCQIPETFLDIQYFGDVSNPLSVTQKLCHARNQWISTIWRIFSKFW